MDVDGADGHDLPSDAGSLNAKLAEVEADIARYGFPTDNLGTQT